MNDALDDQRRITRLVLKALTNTDFSLAESGAIREHGLINRPTEDIDLFTSNQSIEKFAIAIDTVFSTLESDGIADQHRRNSSHFARLLVTVDRNKPSIDFEIDWPENPITQLKVWPIDSIQIAIDDQS